MKNQNKKSDNNENLLRSFYEDISKSPYFLLIMMYGRSTERPIQIR